MSEKTYHGSCHCKTVTFEAKIDLEKGTGRCNCTYCLKSRLWGAQIKPEAFKLLTGEDALVDYVGANNKDGHHLFCKRCGVRSFEKGYLEFIGGAYVTVSVACLDDLSQAEMGALAIHYSDGRDNNWMNTPAVTNHL